jgi:hypothetical protein
MEPKRFEVITRGEVHSSSVKDCLSTPSGNVQAQATEWVHDHTDE